MPGVPMTPQVPVKAKSNLGLIVSLVVVLCLLLGGIAVTGVWMFAKQQVDRRKAEKEAAASIKASLDWVGKNSDSTQPVDLSTAPRSNKPATTDMERMRDFVQGMVVDLATLQNTYLKELNEVGTDHLLDPNRLAADKDFQETHEMLAKITRIIKDTRVKALKLFEELPRRAGNIGLKEADRVGFQREFEEGFNKLLPLLQESWEIESATADRFAQAVEVLETSRGHWEVKDGKFYFGRTADMQRYNEIMAAMVKAGAREQEIQKKLAADSAKSRETLNQLLK